MSASFDRFWDHSNRKRVLAASAGMIALIAVLDWSTLPFVSFGLLYLFPIMLAAVFLPRSAVLALGIFCALLSEAFSSLDPAWRTPRLIFMALALAGCGLFVSELVRNRRLSTQSRQRLHALVETSPAGIITVNGLGIIELANQAAAELLFPGGSSLTGQPIGRFVPQLENALRPTSGGQFRASMQCQVQREGGETFLADVWFSTYRENGNSKLAAIIGDVTEEFGEAESASVEPVGPDLNNRQIAVLRLVFEGLAYREIASRLEITPSAVKNTLQQLYSKMGVHNRSQMICAVLERYQDLL